MEPKSIKLPKPSNNGIDIASFASSILGDFIAASGMPFSATISEVMKIFIKNKLEEAREILLERVRNGEYKLLFDPDYSALVPNYFSYFEAAQRGEYMHNLRILSKLLLDETISKEPDPGKIRRCARRLDAISLDDVRMLSLIKRAFDVKRTSEDFDGYHLCIQPSDVVQIIGRKYKAPEQNINSQFMDLTSRGLLFVGSNPRYVGGHFYYKTDAFDELIEAALELS